MFSFLLLAVISCKKEIIVEPEPVVEQASLLSVKVQEERVLLPERGTVWITFTVTEPAFQFNLTSDVVLFNASSQAPDAFSLSDVRKVGTSGTYTAVLTDKGLQDNEYSVEVRLGIREKAGTEVFVFSPPFTVRGQAAGTHGVVLNTGLPTLYIDTEKGAPIVSKEEYVPALLTIRSSDSSEQLDEVVCSVRGRGNTTWWWPKKPYLLKLEQKEHIFGMHKHKRWVLLANFLDRTLMRNLVSMKVASMTDLAWTPGCRSVELVLNGRHQGNYLLIEQVRVDNHRVAVTEMTPEDNSGEAVTGGYLLESDFHFDNEVQWVDPHGHSGSAEFANGVPFGVKFPDPEDLTTAQLAYIKKYISDTASALYGPDFTDPEKGYAQYIDVDSFVDYWIVFEVMGNHELGNPGSVYFHKDRGGKLVAGPCWDFDWGVLSYNTSPHARTGLVNGKAIWYARLFEDPAFKEKVKARFQELLPQLETIPDFIDETEKMLEASARLNFQMWNPAQDASMNGGYIINGDENMTFHDAVVRLRSIYEERLTVIPNSL